MRHYFQSFALTIRPRAGITDDTIQAVKNWLLKQDYSVAVTEMSNEARHLHAQVWLNEGRTKDDVAKAVKRICERTISDWDATQSKVLRGGIRVAYSDWYLEYLVDNQEKGEVEESNIIVNKPPDKTERFYPSQEEQDAVKSIANATDPRFQSMETACKAYLETNQLDVTSRNVAVWLCYAMFQARTIKVIINQRDRTSLCKALYAYISQSSDTSLFLERTLEEKKLDKKFENTLAMIENYQTSDYSDMETSFI